MRSTRRTSVVTTLVTLFALGAIGVASAFWFGSGTGAGSAASGSLQPVTLNPATASSRLYPGAQAAVSVHVTNPNPGPVRIGALALDTTQGVGGFAVDGGHAACGVSSLSYVTQSNGGTGWNLSGGSASTLTIPNALTMGPAALSSCQGASFSVYLKATT